MSQNFLLIDPRHAGSALGRPQMLYLPVFDRYIRMLAPDRALFGHPRLNALPSFE